MRLGQVALALVLLCGLGLGELLFHLAGVSSCRFALRPGAESGRPGTKCPRLPEQGALLLRMRDSCSCCALDPSGAVPTRAVPPHRHNVHAPRCSHACLPAAVMVAKI